MQLLPILRRCLGPPYKLSTSILVATTLVVAILAGLYSAMAYERLGRETMEAARRWSESVANLVASNNTSAVVLNDVAAIESSLQQVARLPGIINIAVYRADGRILVNVSNTGEALHSTIGDNEQMQPLADGSKVVTSQVVGQVYQAWAVIDAETPRPLAWVRVDFSLSERANELDRLWRQSMVAIVVLVGLVLTSLHFIMAWALRPIRQLSRFAQSIPSRIGSQIDITPTCTEAIQLGVALNTTSRGIAEQVARVNAIVNTAAEAIMGIDAKGMVAMANPATSSIFGRPQEELLGHSLEQCVPGLHLAELQKMVGENISSLGASSRVVRQDLQGRRADGTPFPVEISLGVVHDNKGLRYACIVRDTTDERAAQESSELYERALACSHNAVFITNARGQEHSIVYINEAFKAMTNLPPYEVLGGTIDILRGEQKDDPAFLELESAMREQRNTSVTLSKLLPDGSKQTAEVSLAPVLSGNGVLTHFVGILSDVTARMRAEEAIAERRAQLDAIFSLSPDGFVLFDTQQRLVFANPAFERLTGFNWAGSGEPISMEAFEVIMTDVCDANQPAPSFRAKAADGEPWKARLHLARPHKRVVDAQSRRNVAGRGETILYFRDVTHEDAVDRMKSEFLASAAHELRTPMVSIFGFTELLLRRKFSEERQADMLQTIHKQSGLLVKMINELLDLARIESRRGLDMEIKAHPLEELVHNSVKGLMRAENERQVTVGSVPDAMVMIDPEKMQLAMTNLLSNAFKYSPNGGEVSLTARLEHMGEETFAVLEIRDQGLGMTFEQLERAFERFYRADASGNIPGTGLGLCLVKEIAELHKGKIVLASTFCQGTTASLWIPLAKPTPVLATH